MKVLLIEDEDLDARMMERLVEKSRLAAAPCQRVKYLRDGLALLKEEKFDLILLDLGLPDSLGTETVQKVRQQTDEGIVIVMTGNQDTEVAVEALSLGAQDYLIKTEITPEALHRSVRYAKERYARESELKETNRELGDALQRLKVAQSELVRTERLHALGQMASGVAHDFNNALAAIHANIELLLGSSAGEMPEEDKRKMLKNIRLITEDASAVANRLGLFYKFSKDTKESARFDLNLVVENIIAMTRPRWKDQAQLEGKTITIETDLSPDVWVHGNPAEIREALTNLIFNAIDAISKTGVIRFATSRERSEVSLTLSDDGIGMTPEQQEKCFEPFYTTKEHQTDMSGGSGLGLSMVYGIISRHQGRIQIHSESGKGTSFAVIFPAAEKPAEPAPVVPPKEKTQRDGKETILLVEDEEPIRKAMTQFLRISGYDCDPTSNGREALETFDPAIHHLILTDLSMPKMNGSELAEAIKQKSPKTPIIMLTGYGEMLETGGSDSPHVDLILSKPCKVDLLKEKIESLLPST